MKDNQNVNKKIPILLNFIKILVEKIKKWSPILLNFIEDFYKKKKSENPNMKGNPNMKDNQNIKDPRFEILKKYLELHGIRDIEEENLTEKVMEFQRKKGLKDDGIVEKETLWELQFEPVASEKKLTLKKIPCLQIRDSLDSFLVREDIEGRLLKVFEYSKTKNFPIYSSGGLRALNAKVFKGRSATSFHYTSLAVDFYIWAGLQNPLTDPFVLELHREEEKFTIWASSSDEKDRRVLQGSYIKDSSLLEKEVNRPLFNFTNLLKDNGMTPITIFPDFFTDPKKYYLTSEWWHFQCNQVLVPNFSQFGIELLRIYGIETLEKNPPWDFKKNVFHGNGFYPDIETKI